MQQSKGLQKAIGTERILTKSRSMEYLTIDGLTKMTGVPPDLLDIYTLKELLDNALDAAEMTAAFPSIQVVLSCAGDMLNIGVSDQGTGISLEMVREVTNFERFGGTKYFVKKPTRGAQGNALMTIVGLVAALWKERGQAIPPPITFISRGYRHRVSLRVDLVLERAAVNVESVKISDSDQAIDLPQNGTRIQLSLPCAYSTSWGNSDRYARVVEEFALWNPRARFDLIWGQDHPRVFLPTGKTPKRYNQDDYGSPHWYTLDNFEKLLFANVRALEEQGKRETTLEFAKRFKGCSSNRKEFTETLRDGMAKYLNGIRNHDVSERLFYVIRTTTIPPSPSVLGEVGKEHFRAFMEKWEVVEALFKYKKIQGTLDGTDIPFVLEVAIGATEKLKERRVAFGINGTVTYRSPFEEELYQPSKVTERDSPWQQVKGLRELLGAYRIGPQDPVMVAVHLRCPNIRYGDYGKSTFDTGNVKIPPFTSDSDLPQSSEEES